MRRGIRFPQWWMLLGTDFGKSPWDSTFRLLLAQLDVPGFETLLRSALWPPADCVYIAQVSLYSQSLGVAIAQTTYATDASGEIQALRQLLEAVELEGVLVQADALHANRPFSSTSPSAVPTS